MSPSEFEQRLRALIDAHAERDANVSCLACERCTRCRESTFLRDCTSVSRSHYCERCDTCVACSHSTDCKSCTNCTHCESCTDCVDCAYLVRSTSCAGCTYCFGCVGLVKKDFHILNEPYPREEWFARVAELRRALRLR